MFGDSLPPSLAAVVNAVNEMNDDHDLTNADPDDGQYGEDPAAFLLDVIARQFCCWEAFEASTDFDTCKAQDVLHTVGDLSAVYLHDFSEWEGAIAQFTGACGALGWGLADLLQDQLTKILDEELPQLKIVMTTLPDDLANAVQNMRLSSTLNLSADIDGVASFSHTLKNMSVDLHDLNGDVHTLEASLKSAGLTGLTQQGKATISDQNVLTIQAHEFNHDLGKVIQYTYHSLLLPLLGFTDTKAMLNSLVDCEAIGIKLEEEIGGIDLGFVDAEDYADYCDKGIEEAADFLEETIIDQVASAAIIELTGTAEADEIDANGKLLSVKNGTWAGTWKEDAEQGSFPGTFDAKR